jgi:hypothetical protein
VLYPRHSVPPDPDALEAVAEGLVRLNEWYFTTAAERGVPVPILYRSGVVYRREAPGEEVWESAADVLGVMSDRAGDCEDLAAWRAAELRVFGGDPDAFVKIIRTRRGSFHAVVQRGDGVIEDPSRVLLYLEHQRGDNR